MPGHNHEVTLASFVTKVYTEYFQGNGAILSDDKNQSSCLVKPRYTIIMAPALKNIYPLAQALPRLLPSKKHFLNIVSPDLCDAAIQRLAPSLTPHKGCTIIDINPGAGLWSSKLHQHLKPRSHILVEPCKDMYSPWLMPLVEAPDSRYHLRDWGESTCWDPTQYVSEGLLPKDLGTAGTNRNRNNAILIVANFAESFKRKGRKAIDLVKRIVQLTHEIQTKVGFHTYGPVRMLMWIPETLRSSALPNTVTYRGRFSLRLELTCHVEEIIRGGDGAREKEKRRPEFLDIASSIHALRKMEKSNIHIPYLRQDVIQKRARECLKDPGTINLNRVKDPLGMVAITPRSWHREMEQLEKDFRDGKFSRYSGASINTQSESPEYLRLLELQRNMRHIKKNELTIEELFQEQDVIDSLERDAYSVELDALERETKSRELTNLNERFNTRLEHLSFRVRMQYIHHRDDRRAFAHDPPLLMWDRRSAEPVVAHENEVYPNALFSLLDFQPHPPDLYPMTKEQCDEADLLLMVLFEGLDSNLSSLDVAAPGAYNAIIPQVPALRDPLRGGCRDVSLLKVHMLTREMVYGIIKAWGEWPFRPSLAQLLWNSGMKES